MKVIFLNGEVVEVSNITMLDDKTIFVLEDGSVKTLSANFGDLNIAAITR